MNQEVVGFLSEVAADGSLQARASEVESLKDVVRLAATVGYKFSFDDWKDTISKIDERREQAATFRRNSQPVPGAITANVRTIPNEENGLDYFPESVKI